MLRPWIQIIFIELSLFLLYVFTDMYFALFAFIITNVLMISSILVLIYNKKKINVAVSSKWSSYKEEKGTFYMNVKNNSVFPIIKVTCTLKINNTLTNEEIKKEILLSVKGRENVHVPISFMSEQVGEIKIKVIEVKLYDYFHLWSVTIPSESETSILVLPTYFNIRFLEKHRGFHADQNLAFYREQKSLHGIEMIGLKKYAQDDNAKNIHWKLTSKLDDPIVKELSDPLNENTILVLYENNLAENNSDEIGAKIEAFISLSKSLIENGYEHSIGWYDHDVNELTVEEIRSVEQLTFLQHTILSIQHKEIGISSMNGLLSREISTYSRIFYITSEGNVDNMYSDNLTVLACAKEQDKTRLIDNRTIVFTPNTLTSDLTELTI